jgi:hypothetical protein
MTARRSPGDGTRNAAGVRVGIVARSGAALERFTLSTGTSALISVSTFARHVCRFWIDSAIQRPLLVLCNMDGVERAALGRLLAHTGASVEAFGVLDTRGRLSRDAHCSNLSVCPECEAGAEFQRCSAHAYQPKMWITPPLSRWVFVSRDLARPVQVDDHIGHLGARRLASAGAEVCPAVRDVA